MVGPVRITNIVATSLLGTVLDLKHIERKLPMTQYIPERFSGLLIRVLRPFKAHCMVYKNGKITVNGARSVRSAMFLTRRFARMLHSIGYDFHLTNFKVVNMVGAFSFPRKLPLEEISTKLKILYCPEIFPGLTVKLSDCTAVLFHSGKVNFLGGKCNSDIQSGQLELEILIG